MFTHNFQLNKLAVVALVLFTSLTTLQCSPLRLVQQMGHRVSNRSAVLPIANQIALKRMNPDRRVHNWSRLEKRLIQELPMANATFSVRKDVLPILGRHFEQNRDVVLRALTRLQGELKLAHAFSERFVLLFDLFLDISIYEEQMRVLKGVQDVGRVQNSGRDFFHSLETIHRHYRHLRKYLHGTDLNTLLDFKKDFLLDALDSCRLSHSTLRCVRMSLEGRHFGSFQREVVSLLRKLNFDWENIGRNYNNSKEEVDMLERDSDAVMELLTEYENTLIMNVNFNLVKFYDAFISLKLVREFEEDPRSENATVVLDATNLTLNLDNAPFLMHQNIKLEVEDVLYEKSSGLVFQEIYEQMMHGVAKLSSSPSYKALFDNDKARLGWNEGLAESLGLKSKLPQIYEARSTFLSETFFLGHDNQTLHQLASHWKSILSSSLPAFLEHELIYAEMQRHFKTFYPELPKLEEMFLETDNLCRANLDEIKGYYMGLLDYYEILFSSVDIRRVNYEKTIGLTASDLEKLA